MPLSRNPYAARAARTLSGKGGSPWNDQAADAPALATIGAVDELRRANQIALARALGDGAALEDLAEALGVGQDPDRSTIAA